MKHPFVGALTVACAGALLVNAAAPSTKASAVPTARPGVAKIALPGDLDFQFKNAPGVRLVQSTCLTCHSSAYVSTQPRLTREQWTAEVNKMKNAYKAPIADDDVPKIADYLTAAYGKF